MEAPYSLRSWADPHVAERAEAILDRIAQRRLNSCPLQAGTDNHRADDIEDDTSSS